MSLPQTLWKHLLGAHQGKILEILKKAPHKIFALGLLVCRSNSSLVSQTCFTRVSKRLPEHPGGFLYASSTIGSISASVGKVIIPQDVLYPPTGLGISGLILHTSSKGSFI